MQAMQGSTWRGNAAGVVLGALALCGVAAADTICVPDDYETIQGAIDAAAMKGDEICVAPGTYNETIDFIGKAVRLYSTEGPEVTTIDATGFWTSVVKCGSGEGAETVLEGFTITGGASSDGGGMFNWDSSPTVIDCTFIGNEADDGAGILNHHSDPTIRDCTFRENIAYRQAGGMSNRLSSSPTVTNCTFIENFAVEGGGGMVNSDSSPTVTNCTFTANTAWTDGGGMSNNHSSPTVTACTFHANSCGYGGGMRNWHSSDPTVTGCTFTENAASDGGGGMSNGDSSSPRVTNCTFIGNRASLEGGGMENYWSSPAVTNCTFIGNRAFQGGGMYNAIGGPTVTNSIFWDNVGGQMHGSTPSVTYSDIQDGYEGVGNIDADPLCDDDGRPQAGSPCIDAGANNAVPADLLDLDNDGDTIERVPIDLDGNHRFMDDGATEDTGCGPVVVDMGAFEFPGEPVHPVLIGDIDLDGEIDFDDLLRVLDAWGECDPACCPADVNFTWEVGFDDLLIVLDNWS